MPVSGAEEHAIWTCTQNSRHEEVWRVLPPGSLTPFSLDDAFPDGAHLFRRIRCERSGDALEQFRLEFRAVRLQVQRLARVEPDLLCAIGQDDHRPLMGLGNKFRQLALSLSDSPCFHVRSLTQTVRIGKQEQPSEISPWAHVVHEQTRV